MKNITVAAVAVLALAAGAGCQPKEQAPAAPETGFEFTVEKTGKTMLFQAVNGVAWRSVGYSCKALPCEFTLNEDGVNGKMASPGMSIAFKVSDKDVEMTSSAGAAWQTLDYSCEGNCSFTVNEKGVAGAK